MTEEATTDDSRREERGERPPGFHIHLSKFLGWVVGMATTLAAAAVISGAATILSVDRRVEGIERNMVTSQELRALETRIQREYVTLREYEVRQRELIERLDRMDERSLTILERVDQLLARDRREGP